MSVAVIVDMLKILSREKGSDIKRLNKERRYDSGPKRKDFKKLDNGS